MHSTQANMVLSSRPNTGHWWRQEGHPVLNSRTRTKILSDPPFNPHVIGGNGGKIEAKIVDLPIVHCLDIVRCIILFLITPAQDIFNIEARGVHAPAVTGFLPPENCPFSSQIVY